ncbi:MAG: hypothetical protein ACRCZF_22235, partial [Gemmataceae bacterium]
TLSEQQGSTLVRRAEVTVTLDPQGKPVPVRLKHIPTDIGEKEYIIEATPTDGEKDRVNNRIVRRVSVTDNKKLRVLYIEATPRYEYRFLKVLLEREIESGRSVRAFELQTLLLDASKDYASTDRAALRGFPTRSELFEYDVVLLGDIDPETLPRPTQTLSDLADFVRVRGGGMLVIAGHQAMPQKLFATPLADVLPVLPPETPRGGAVADEDLPDITETYKPKLTPTGLLHPIFRFSGDESANVRIWNGLQPMFWSATGYRKRQSAEVLAVHPTRLGDGGENYPLVLQQFAGAGRVIFFGFEETWRWRYRSEEEQFNRFWRQTVRVLARNRVARTELRTDRQTPYRRDEPITITVQFPDDAPAPSSGVKIRLDATSVRGDRETQRLTLTKREGTRGTFQSLVTRTPEGTYRFTLEEPSTP